MNKIVLINLNIIAKETWTYLKSILTMYNKFVKM